MLPRVEDDGIWVPPDSFIQTKFTSMLNQKRNKEEIKKASTHKY